MLDMLIIISWLVLGFVLGYIFFRGRTSFIFWLVICTIFGIPGLVLALLFYPREKKKPEIQHENPVDSRLKSLQTKQDFEKSKSEKLG